MALRSGLDYQLGMVAETTWGTFATPTRFLETLDDGLVLTADRDESAAMRAGNRVLREDRWSAGRKQVGGTQTFEVANRGFGLLLEHCLGTNTITTPTGGTNTRDHTITLGDLWGKSLTLQKGVPGIDGTVRALSMLGCKVASWEISNDPDGYLLLAATFDGKAEDQGQALASVSYPSNQTLFNWTQGVISIGGVNTDLKSFSLSGENGLDTERFHIGSGAGAKLQQIPAGLVDLTGSMVADFTDLTLYNNFVNGTEAQVICTWTGAVIEGSFNFHVKITLPVVRFDGATPQVSGLEVVEQPLEFKVLNPTAGTQPITIEYRTDDTAA